MRPAIVVVVASSRHGVDAVRVRGEIVEQAFFPMHAMQPFQHTIRFGMGHAGRDVADAGEGDEPPPLAADELAAMIVD